MINGLDIYYSKNIGKGLQSVTTKQQINLRKSSGLKPIGKGCKKVGSGLKLLQ